MHITAQAPRLRASTAHGVVRTKRRQQKKQRTGRKRTTHTHNTEISCRQNPPGIHHCQTVGQPLGQGPPGGLEDSHCVVVNNQTDIIERLLCASYIIPGSVLYHPEGGAAMQAAAYDWQQCCQQSGKPAALEDVCTVYGRGAAAWAGHKHKQRPAAAC